jgi:hypothetical protein
MRNGLGKIRGVASGDETREAGPLESQEGVEVLEAFAVGLGDPRQFVDVDLPVLDRPQEQELEVETPAGLQQYD